MFLIITNKEQLDQITSLVQVLLLKEFMEEMKLLLREIPSKITKVILRVRLMKQKDVIKITYYIP